MVLYLLHKCAIFCDDLTMPPVGMLAALAVTAFGSHIGLPGEAGRLVGERASRRLEQTHNGPQGCQGSDVSAERYGGRFQTELRGA